MTFCASIHFSFLLTCLCFISCSVATPADRNVTVLRSRTTPKCTYSNYLYDPRVDACAEPGTKAHCGENSFFDLRSSVEVEWGNMSFDEELTYATEDEGENMASDELTYATEGDGENMASDEVTFATEGDGENMDYDEVTSPAEGEGENMSSDEFTSSAEGACVCDNAMRTNCWGRPQIRSEQRDKCWHLGERGPCAQDQVLIVTSENKIQCGPDACVHKKPKNAVNYSRGRSSQEVGKPSEDDDLNLVFDFTFNGECLQNGNTSILPYWQSCPVRR